MIYVLLADGFEDIEAIEPLDILKRADIPVKTVGVYEKTVTSAHNLTVSADILIDEVNLKDMDMLVLPGGPGHTLLDESSRVHELISYAQKNDIFLAAICASPSIFGKLGILDKKRYTCFPGYEKFAPKGDYTGEKVVLDGKILTGKGAGTAADFGFKIVEIFKGKELCDKLKKTMQYI